MAKPRMHPQIRAVLQGGQATAAWIAEAIGARDSSSVTTSLRSMPDAYIADWVPCKGPRGHAAVWAVVDVPEDAPKPE